MKYGCEIIFLHNKSKFDGCFGTPVDCECAGFDTPRFIERSNAIWGAEKEIIMWNICLCVPSYLFIENFEVSVRRKAQPYLCNRPKNITSVESQGIRATMADNWTWCDKGNARYNLKSRHFTFKEDKELWFIICKFQGNSRLSFRLYYFTHRCVVSTVIAVACVKWKVCKQCNFIRQHTALVSHCCSPGCYRQWQLWWWWCQSLQCSKTWSSIPHAVKTPCSVQSIRKTNAWAETINIKTTGKRVLQG
jgi:hypothetical protein